MRCVVLFCCLTVVLSATQKKHVITFDPEACSSATRPKNVTGTGGTIESSNYPSDYEPNQHCEWLITVENGTFIEVTFGAIFAVEDCTDCNCDYLTVFDGPSDSSAEYGPFCGSFAPPDVISSSNQVLIRFRSDETSQLAGFTLTWARVTSGSSGACDLTGGGQVITDSEGNFTSPGYPIAYETDLLCRWILTAPPGMSVAARITDFSTEASYAYDFLDVHDGTNFEAECFGRVTGTEGRATYISTNSSLLFRFRSDESVSSRGFHVTYKHIPRPAGLPRW